jgi:hypothetical protein
MIIDKEVFMSRVISVTWQARLAAGVLALVLGVLTLVSPSGTLSRSGSGERDSVAYLFLSANTDERLSVAQAFDRLRSPVHAHFRGVVGAILDQLEVGRYRVVDGVGDWSDGAENSILVKFADATDENTLRYAAVWFGLLANQKSVLAFVADPAGPDAVLTLDLPTRDMQLLRNTLDRQGIPCRTLVPRAEGCHIVVFDKGRQRTAALRQLAGRQDVFVRTLIGKGFSVGETTRGRARQRYHQEIRRYEDGGSRRLRPDQLPLLAKGVP